MIGACDDAFSPLFWETGAGNHVLRDVLVELEPTVVGEGHSGTSRQLFHSKQSVNGKQIVSRPSRSLKLTQITRPQSDHLHCNQITRAKSDCVRCDPSCTPLTDIGILNTMMFFPFAKHINVLNFFNLDATRRTADFQGLTALCAVQHDGCPRHSDCDIIFMSRFVTRELI
jgi:hypothetical protein